MSSRSLVLLLIAGVLAIGTVVLVKSRMQAPVPKQAVVAQHMGTRVLVAKRPIAVGSFVKTALDLQWADWPTDGLQPSYIKEGSEDMHNFEGAVARHAVNAGEAVTANDIIKPGAGGFLSAVLEPGMRAVSIAVSATSGTAGFIFPGDRVDLIVTHHMKVKAAPGTDDDEAVVGETFVKDVRVVAVDQMLDNPDNKAILAKTVTVEVTLEQAQRISVAEDIGKISLALRSLAADAPIAKAAEGGPVALHPTDNPDLVSELTQPQPLTGEPAKHDPDISASLVYSNDLSPRVRVIRGDQSEQREFYKDPQ